MRPSIIKAKISATLSRNEQLLSMNIYSHIGIGWASCILMVSKWWSSRKEERSLQSVGKAYQWLFAVGSLVLPSSFFPFSFVFDAWWSWKQRIRPDTWNCSLYFDGGESPPVKREVHPCGMHPYGDSWKEWVVIEGIVMKVTLYKETLNAGLRNPMLSVMADLRWWFNLYPM